MYGSVHLFAFYNLYSFREMRVQIKGELLYLTVGNNNCKL